MLIITLDIGLGYEGKELECRSKERGLPV
jgi:hypothetical protein